MKKCNIGGQGVLEGVMMRSPDMTAIAVRKQSGEIVYTRKDYMAPSKKNKFYGLPIVRGVVMFVEALGSGVKTLSDSAKMYDDSTAADYEPSKFEKYIAKKTGKNAMDVMMVFAVVVAMALAIGLFFILPLALTNLIATPQTTDFVKNLIDGGIRIVIFLAYILAVTMMKDIKRVFKYHGAEHKTINCYEHEDELTVENVQKYKTLHPRCGTSYLLIVMVIAILLFSLLKWSSVWYLQYGLRLLMLPVVAGVSYEFLKFAAKGEGLFFRIIRAPGMALQKLTTKLPEDDIVEVAIVSFFAAMKDKTDDEIAALAAKYDRRVKTDDTEETAAASEETAADPTGIPKEDEASGSEEPRKEAETAP
jgi:uncharacterized protein YqhQ